LYVIDETQAFDDAELEVQDAHSKVNIRVRNYGPVLHAVLDQQAVVIAAANTFQRYENLSHLPQRNYDNAVRALKEAQDALGVAGHRF
jgi:hypothetical protein